MKFFTYVLLVGVGVLCLLATGDSAPTFRLGNIIATPLPPANVAASTNPSAAVLAHFDADACLDLAVVSYGGRTPRQTPPGQLLILFGNCAGAFGASTSGGPMLPFGVALQGPVDVTQADFNRDGCADVATADNISSTATIARPTPCQLNAPPQFGLAAVALQIIQPPAATVPTLPQAVVAADFNRDSWPDLAVASFNPIELGPTSTVSVFIANSTRGGLPAVAGTPQVLTSTNGQIGQGPISLAAADFNSDGRPDLAVANSESNSVAILAGTGEAGPPGRLSLLPGIFTPIQFDNAPWSLQAADFDNNDIPDLAVVFRYSNNVRIFLGTGAGGFIERPRIATCSQPVSVAVGDFNDDSNPDLAVACWESANVNLYQGQGNGNFSFIVTIDATTAVNALRGTVNVTDVVTGKILSGPAAPGADECDDVAFLVAPNTPVQPAPGIVVVQPTICAP